MKIQFSINPVALFLRGENCESSIVTVNLNTLNLPDHKRKLIAERLLPGETADVFRVVHDPEKAKQGLVVPVGGCAWDTLVEAEEPTVDSLCLKLEELNIRHESIPSRHNSSSSHPPLRSPLHL